MVTEGSTAMRCAAEFGKIISQHFDVFPPRIYAYTDGGPERKVDDLWYKNPISAFFSITTLTKYQWHAQQLIYRFEILWSVVTQLLTKASRPSV